MFPPPQPPKKSGVGKIVGLGCAGLLALFVVVGLIGAAVSGGDGDSADTSSKDKAVAADAEPKSERSAETAGEGEAAAEEEETEAAGTGSQAEQFRACVAKNGTATEKAAIEHVTKVTGADRRNDIFDTAEVFTDYTGGLMGPHQGD
ncbi:hypothetical protein NGM37_22110, partial [Streptomyces sp. TRM76130]|nr:hypothetical protein [Streptomyces sp. TRM76130]